MSVTSLITQPCTLLTRAEGVVTDDYGNPVDVEDETETVCHIQQRSRDEAGDQGEASVADWTAFFRADEDADTASALVVGGRTFEFVGSPWPVTDPELNNSVSHIEATVRYTGQQS